MKNLKLPITNIHDSIDKKDAWFVWTENKDGKIDDFSLYDYAKEDYSGKISPYYVEHIYGKNYYDWGACLSGWHQVTLENVFFKFGFEYEFLDKSIFEKFMNHLTLVNEWKSEILSYMSYLGMKSYFYEEAS